MVMFINLFFLDCNINKIEGLKDCGLVMFATFLVIFFHSKINVGLSWITMFNGAYGWMKIEIWYFNCNNSIYYLNGYLSTCNNVLEIEYAVLKKTFYNSSS